MSDIKLGESLFGITDDEADNQTTAELGVRDGIVARVFSVFTCWGGLTLGSDVHVRSPTTTTRMGVCLCVTSATHGLLAILPGRTTFHTNDGNNVGSDVIVPWYVGSDVVMPWYSHTAIGVRVGRIVYRQNHTSTWGSDFAIAAVDSTACTAKFDNIKHVARSDEFLDEMRRHKHGLWVCVGGRPWYFLKETRTVTSSDTYHPKAICDDANANARADADILHRAHVKGKYFGVPVKKRQGHAFVVVRDRRARVPLIGEAVTYDTPSGSILIGMIAAHEWREPCRYIGVFLDAVDDVLRREFGVGCV